MSSTPTAPVIHGRCACGCRFRIRNAAPGIAVSCPRCSRAISITDADLRAAFMNEPVALLQGDSAGAPMAELVDYGELRLAEKDARPGLTGRTEESHEEAMLMRALAGGLSLGLPSGSGTSRSIATSAGLPPARARTFVEDVFLSFVFAGVANNALNILATSSIASLAVALLIVLPFGMGFICLIPLVGVVLYLVQFCWSVAKNTANGEDEIPWFEADWDLMEDAVWPALQILGVSFLCTVPALLVAAVFPSDVVLLAALAAGWFFWPVAILSLSVGDSVMMLRPDLLVRCIFGIGPAYLLAWGVSIAVAFLWSIALTYGWRLLYIPVVGVALWYYLSYVLYRTIGLLFRHFRHRLPWRF
ncbi:MAG: hypothetical protein U1D55_12050 [Phycisphaerae bacterium]